MDSVKGFASEGAWFICGTCYRAFTSPVTPHDIGPNTDYKIGECFQRAGWMQVVVVANLRPPTEEEKAANRK